MKTEIQLYDWAKKLVEVEEPMDPIMFTRKVNEIATKMTKKKYWMLLCRERNDYTIFNINTEKGKNISKELIPTLRNRGLVLLMDEQPDGAFEIWIRDSKTKENFAYYLFDYSSAVINCK